MNDEREEQASLRPRLGPIALAVVANLLFGGVLLGLPYLRGQSRARDSTSAFSRFAACLFRAEIAEDPGLTLPRGERARFATNAIGDDDAWPARCDRALDRVEQERADFLFPSVKNAEEEVRASAQLVRRELRVVARRRGVRRVPLRALDALARLQGALVELTRASGIELDPQREVITIDPSRDLTTPTLVPLNIATGRAWDVWLEDRALHASAMDSRAVATAVVEDGGVDLRATRRPQLASSFVRSHVIWSTPPEQCGDGDCAQRATGIVELVEDRQALAPAAWLRAHPAASAPRSISLAGDTAWIAALGDGGGLDVRSFALAATAPSEAPLAPTFTRTIDPQAREPDVEWLEGAPALAWTSRSGSGLWIEGQEPRAFEEHGERVATCGTARNGWIVLAGRRASRVVRIDGPSHPLSFGGELRVICDRSAIVVYSLMGEDVRRARCDLEGCAEERDRVAEGVVRFDAVRFRGADLLVWTDDALDGAIRLVRIARDGSVRTTIPAVCWEPAEGMCGEPRIIADAQRVVLVARENANLRILESEDGRRWRALEGLEQP
jgi:hypothetical protein